MKPIPQYIVDAFTDELFAGNPAAVCIVDEFPDPDIMRAIARENRLSETAFVRKSGDHWHLRWFTPGEEVDLCGHATLASAYVLFRFFEPEADCLHFETLGGMLTVCQKDGLLELDFPQYELEEVEVTDQMEKALGVRPLQAFKGRDLLCILENEQEVISLQPDLDRIRELDGLLVHVSARGSRYDCVSRSFGPRIQIDEDPVCGSAHCHIVPYWSEKLGKDEILARQASQRGGTLWCRMDAPRVRLAGKAVLFSEGTLHLDG